MKLKQVDFELLFLSLVPIGYILGGMVPVPLTPIIYAVLFVIALYRLLVNKREIKFAFVDVLFYLWGLILVFSIFYTPQQTEGVSKTFTFFAAGLSLIFFARLFIKDRKDVELLFKYLLIASVITGYLVILDFILSGSDSVRYAAFGHIVPIPLSMLGATTTLMLIIYYLYQKITLVPFIFALIPSVSMMTIAASKGPVFSLLITTGLLIPVLIKKIKIRHFILLPLVIYGLNKVPTINRTLENLMFRINNTQNDASTDIRLNLYGNAFDVFYLNPLLGIGVGGLDGYPHNIFLEVLMENGLLLFLVVMLIFVYAIVNYIGFVIKRSNDCVEALIVSLFIISLSSLMFSFTYVDHKYFFLSIGLMISYRMMPASLKKLSEEKVKKKRRFKRYRIVWEK